MVKGAGKSFHDGSAVIGKLDAIQKYQDPQFFERPGPSMTPDDLREILQRNIA